MHTDPPHLALTWLADWWPYAIGVLAFALLCWWARREPRQPVFEYDPQPVMNDGEWACYQALLKAVAAEYHVFAQVSLYAIVRHRSAEGWPRIAQKSCDFALVDIQTRQTALVIEVDGRQHQTSERQRQRDHVKDSALASAGIPILRLPAAKRYDAVHLAAALRAALRESD